MNGQGNFNGTKICPTCGAQVNQAAAFCNFCGARLNQPYNNSGNIPNYQPAPPNYNNGVNYNAPGYYGGGAPIKTDRSLLMYILLTLVTCGIYSWIFLHEWAKDINTMCDGDGETTAGLLKLVLLTLVTCGIYSLYWYYSIGNRLSNNARRYGLSFQENGTTVLLWYIFGALICFIGPFVALHILIKNTNSMAMAYNRQHGYM